MNLFSPAQIAENYVSIGKSKVNTAIPKMFLLAVMAGVFIALGRSCSNHGSRGRTACCYRKASGCLHLSGRPHHGTSRRK